MLRPVVRPAGGSEIAAALPSSHSRMAGSERRRANRGPAGARRSTGVTHSFARFGAYSVGAVCTGVRWRVGAEGSCGPLRLSWPRRALGEERATPVCRLSYNPYIRTFAILGLVLHQHIGVATSLELAGLGLGAGWLGAVVGVGGGVVIVPALVLAFGFATKVAVASSLVAVIATSLAAGSAYAGAGQTNLRLALVLEIATAAGGLLGGIVAILIAPTFIDGLFAVVMMITAVLMVRSRDKAPPPVQPQRAEVSTDEAPDEGVLAPAEAQALVAAGARVGWEERGRLGGAYHDRLSGTLVHYRPIRLWLGLSVSLLAGMLSGLLGVGGGFLKVPAMSLGMKVPIKVSAATSNFMIGVTAVASLIVYFARGYLLPFAAAPIALGVAAGAYGGAKSAQRVSARTLGWVLAGVLVLVAVQMGTKAAGVAHV